MDPHVFLASVITGVTSALTTVALLWLAREGWYWLCYWPLRGQYDVHRPDGSRREDEVIEVCYQGGRRLLLRSFVFSSAQQRWVENWDSTVTMSLDLPWYGEGLFEYKTLTGAGIHTLKVNRAQRTILVVGENKAGGDTTVPFPFVLRRRLERLALRVPGMVRGVAGLSQA